MNTLNREVINMFSNIFKIAKAHIKGSSKYTNINGWVSFKEVQNGVLLTAKITGLPHSANICKGNFFGFHIHERKFLYRKF